MVDVKGLEEVVAYVRGEWGGSVLATDIFTREGGTSLASYNHQPAACKVFGELTAGLDVALAGSKFPPLNKYYLLDLKPNLLVIVVPTKDHLWGILLSTENLKMGMVFMVLQRGIERLHKVRGIQST